jgi:nuclear pore complex protein Nup93
MAYDCQSAAQPEEATELFLAAQRPRLALAITNQQLADTIPQAVQEQVRG